MIGYIGEIKVTVDHEGKPAADFKILESYRGGKNEESSFTALLDRVSEEIRKSLDMQPQQYGLLPSAERLRKIVEETN